MIKKSADQRLLLRPHFKTHQSHEVGHWFRDAGVKQITTSSVEMAAYFAQDGWSDITIAFPFNTLESNTLNNIEESITLNLCVESVEVMEMAITSLKRRANIMLLTDIGYHRTGIDPQDHDTMERIIDMASSADHLTPVGFLGHAGHSYQCRGRHEIQDVHVKSTAILAHLKKRYDLMTSCGDTPTCSIAEHFNGIDEIRPGNFIYYDLSQYHIGSCELDDVAVAMACPVVAIHPERDEAVIYGGGVHFSKDRTEGPNGLTYYGLMVKLTDSGWELLHEAPILSSVSQEHGVLKGPGTKALKPGDVVGVLPVHSCMAVDCMKDKGWISYLN